MFQCHAYPRFGPFGAKNGSTIPTNPQNAEIKTTGIIAIVHEKNATRKWFRICAKYNVGFVFYLQCNGIDFTLNCDRMQSMCFRARYR